MEAAFWKDDRLSAADWDDVTNKVVSSAYTRSVKDDESNLMPVRPPDTHNCRMFNAPLLGNGCCHSNRTVGNMSGT